MRAIGIDVGEQRIGIAVSDDSGLITAPHGVVRRSSTAIDEILAIAGEVGAQTIVVGLPLTMRGGREGTQAALVRNFGEAIAAQTSVPVEYYDERLTTVMAERTLQAQGRRSTKKRADRDRRREALDAIAAAIILQSWLDRRRYAARLHTDDIH